MLAMHSMKSDDDRDSEFKLDLESALLELPLWTTQVEIHKPGNEIALIFEQEPLLPGIILTRNQQYLGIISRRSFFEQMSRPYGLGLFAGRPIEHLYNFLQPETFILPEEMTIVEATQAALGRSSQLVYEPVLVESKSLHHGLLDFQQLLVAYSQIQVLTLQRLQKEKERARVARAGFLDLQHNYTRLLQNEKMIALGQLVAGIAHEINNPMNFIYGNLNYASEYVEDLISVLKSYQQGKSHDEVTAEADDNGLEVEFIMEDLPKLLSSMKVGATRINEIVLSLRNFSRLDEAAIKAVDIHEGIDNTLIILKTNLKARPERPEIQIIKEYGELPLVECYAGQLNQVFMNIIANGIDALSETYQSLVENGDLDVNPDNPYPLKICIRTEATEDNHIIISISDNGKGIPEDVQTRLFDPFFTTKPVGKGTGLGLSISYQIIVEKHCGEISCVSSPGNGAEFIIKIPSVSSKPIYREEEAENREKATELEVMS
jgi:signal transduction histidine kinase